MVYLPVAMYYNAPAKAIIAPLSIAYLSSIPPIFPPLSYAICWSISWSLSLQPTPPTTITSFD